MIENFGKNVARLRKERDMTQTELAKAIGVNKQTISNIEKGEGYPTFNNLEKISQVLKATPIELFGTLKEIALQDTSEIMDRIDRYSNKIQEILQAQAFLEDIMYDDEVKNTMEMVAMLYNMFHQPIMKDEEGAPILDDKTGEARMGRSQFEKIPFEKIKDAAAQLSFIINNCQQVDNK